MLKKVLCAGLAVMMLAVAGCGDSKDANKQASKVKWPKNVEIVVPYGAGGDTDFNARLLAQKLSKKLGSNFVVSNVTGNGGATGSRKVKDGKKDGSIILFNHTAFVVNKASKASDFGFNDFAFASVVGLNPGNVIVVNKSLGINSLAELKQYSQAHPNELKIAVQTGATSYVIADQLLQDGFKLKMVDAGAASSRLTALLGGHVDVIFSPYGGVKDYIEKGEMVPLAMDGENNLVVPDKHIDVKNIKNQGFNAYVPFYYFVAFPKGTDQALVDSFNAAAKDIIENDKEYQKKIYDMYFQKPFFAAGQEGLDKFAPFEKALEKIQFTQVAKEQ
ncbi:tripartite tricarboxylate transporter substrate binding protein [Acidaminococcus sp. NSJ-142]|uniref:tripartite tricarboxylate transporter substrate binding protein n=1 Tax=Acidaminococcus TaxID=904 RepID=UPI000CF95FB7|nr:MULTISPECIES: tripartite tricarboxylate transporter substrate binding protein [Acidaminococcus]MCD2435322.1 tripartite tricarboxylate transporter substrate binding protein [Acidaminococcus hominis]